MRLSRRLCPWLYGFSWCLSFTWTTRRWLRQQTSSHHALVTNGDSGRLLVRPTPHMRALDTFASSSESLTRQTDRQSDFHYRCSFFPHGENTRLGHAHTDSQRDSCVVECRFFRDTTSVRSSLSALNANFLRPFLSFLLHMTVSLTTQASPELRNFLPILQLSCFHISRTTGKSKFHCLCLGLYSIRIQSPVFPSVNQRCMAPGRLLTSAIFTLLAKSMPRPHHPRPHPRETRPDRNFVEISRFRKLPI